MLPSPIPLETPVRTSELGVYGAVVIGDQVRGLMREHIRIKRYGQLRLTDCSYLRRDHPQLFRAGQISINHFHYTLVRFGQTRRRILDEDGNFESWEYVPVTPVYPEWVTPAYALLIPRRREHAT